VRVEEEACGSGAGRARAKIGTLTASLCAQSQNG
jgi:hypothetical protein